MRSPTHPAIARRRRLVAVCAVILLATLSAHCCGADETTPAASAYVQIDGAGSSFSSPDNVIHADPAKRDALKAFIRWGLTRGQDELKDLAYARLPKDLVVRELKALDGVQ
ncbi:MAG: hypothetical protein ACREJ2_15745 [Planctomycetota bacterium]